MAGLRLTQFAVSSPDVAVSFGLLNPGDLFEASGEPFIKMETTKRDNALSLRTYKCHAFDSTNMVIPLVMVVTKTSLTYERVKMVERPVAPPVTPLTYGAGLSGDQLASFEKKLEPKKRGRPKKTG